MWLKRGSRFSCGHASATMRNSPSRRVTASVCLPGSPFPPPPAMPPISSSCTVRRPDASSPRRGTCSVRPPLYAYPSSSTARRVGEEPPQLTRPSHPLPPNRPDKQASRPLLDLRPRPCWSWWVVCLTCKSLVRSAASPFDDQRAVAWRHIGLALLLFRLTRP